MKDGEVLASTINGLITFAIFPVAHVGLSSRIGFGDVLWWDARLSGPLAILVFWRTLVHARRFCREHVVGRQPLIEAAMTGLFVPILFVYPLLLNAPRVYLILVVGTVIGLFFGVLFRSIALFCLRGAA